MAKCEKQIWEWGYLDCKAKEKVGDGVGDILDGQMKEFAQSLSDMVAEVMKWFTSWWMKAPAPDLDSPAIAQVTGDLSWYTAAFAIVGLLFAVVRLVMSQDLKTLVGSALQPIVNLVVVTACYATGLGILLKSGDAFSEWILDRATTGVAGGADLSTLVVLGPSLGIGPWIIFALLALLSSTVNVVFMFVRNVLMTVMMVFIPTLAAASGTETGKQAFSKANGYLLAFVLFKPVAAVIYALGLRIANSPLTSDPESDSVLGDIAQSAITAMVGLTILTLAALALPALMKFLIPVAATGAGGFSGGAALAGAVTIGAGAAVLASTGGAGAGAGAGAGSKAAAAQGESSAATQGGTGTGSGSTPPGGGESPAGTGSGSTPPGGGSSSSEGGSSAPESSGSGSGDSGGEQAGAGAQSESGDSSGDSGGETSVAGAGAGSESAGGSGGDSGSETSVAGAGAGSESAGSSGEDAGATGAGSGTGGGGRSIADAAAVMGAVSDATSGAGSGVEKAIEDE
ncbi:hypothetical protein [Brevibacterium sp. FME37]|uniref:hypothetical protein n=1 Tax=Brevibacterium sp. FME37 TaxID=2742607 RepID=UPI0018670124|nr:hypothetical protein [Brevibacterium sp. FME37]